MQPRNAYKSHQQCHRNHINVSKTEGINMTANHPSVITNCGIPDLRLSNQHTTCHHLVPIFHGTK